MKKDRRLTPEEWNIFLKPAVPTDRKSNRPNLLLLDHIRPNYGLFQHWSDQLPKEHTQNICCNILFLYLILRYLLFLNYKLFLFGQEVKYDTIHKKLKWSLLEFSNLFFSIPVHYFELPTSPVVLLNCLQFHRAHLIRPERNDFIHRRDFKFWYASVLCTKMKIWKVLTELWWVFPIDKVQTSFRTNILSSV